MNVTITETVLRAPDGHGPGGYQLRMAANQAEVLAAARLRDQVFTVDCGARTPGPAGLDLDDFDDLCDHLIVWHTSALGEPETAVATYRLLPPHANDCTPRRLGLYAQSEFDLTPLEPLLDNTIEAGRACVAADHRGSAAIGLLWAGIARYMLKAGARYLIGCASVSLADGPGQAALFHDLARARHWAPPEQQCRAWWPMPTAGVPRPERLRIPPLLHGYLRLGAAICSEPAWDERFGCADFLILLDLHHTDPRYLRRFLHDIEL